MLKPVVRLAAIFALILESAFAVAADCPAINGRYSYEVKQSGAVVARWFVTMYTRVAGGAFSYTYDLAGNYQVADGVARPHLIRGVKVTLKMTCRDGTMFLETRVLDSGTLDVVKMTPKSRTELHLESTIPGRTGLYLLQE